MTIASGARREADSFETDIKTAKQQAADAESHLAEALKEASAAQAELNRLKTPRSLTNVAALVSALAPLKGTEFTFIGVFGDQESRDLAAQISSTLQLAGWKPVSAPNAGRLPGPWIRIDNFPTTVMGSVSTGVHVGTESKETPEALNALPAAAQWPPQLVAAWTLQRALASSISPPDTALPKDTIGIWQHETATAVTLEIGKKL
jgi:hypothetical protein